MVQNAHPPLDNPHVRWAISYAIDRNALPQLAYEGATVPTWGIWPFYDANQPYFDAVSDLRAQYPSTRSTGQVGEPVEPGRASTRPTSHLKYVVNCRCATRT